MRSLSRKSKTRLKTFLPERERERERARERVPVFPLTSKVVRYGAQRERKGESQHED